MVDIQLTGISGPKVAAQPLEIVERKGLGHPDTICDALAENLSVSLCRWYQQRFGAVLHHNVDKGLLFGGKAAPRFGGGELLEPIGVYLVGRASMSFKGVSIPVEELAVESSRQWFREHFHALDPEKHLKIHCLFRPGSQDLTELYLRQAGTGVALANDTSCGVGYAPLDDLEQVVLGVERHLNSKAFHQQYPMVGQDIKVMGVRRHDAIHLTVACAFVDRYLRDMADYRQGKEWLAAQAVQAAGALTEHAVQVEVNTADNPDSGSVYLTVSGSSGEAGDDGEVGRGNRVNGLITPCRPMNMEAAAGKNPVSHVGKLYNIVAHRLAARLVKEIAEVEEASCFLVSQIGKPVTAPQCVEVRVRLPAERFLAVIRPQVSAIVEASLADMTSLWQEVLAGGVEVY